MKLFDTIAAVSTPYGKGGVAMIRISGEDAISVAEKVFFSASGKPLSELAHAKIAYGRICSSDTKAEIDDGMAAVFFAPRSFTGENTVEISCHGGVFVTRKVLSAVLSAGARHAEAGEFTRRAYINGRMKLDEAEALGGLLEARSEAQVALARGGMKGRVSNAANGIYCSLRSVLSAMYAYIDFPDEDLAEVSREEMLRICEDAHASLCRLMSTYDTGRAVNEGVQTVICGRTNAGKSSVYNRILGYDAAIVTDIEGTTRDVLRETAVFGKVSLRLCDTAGFRQTKDRVESIGIERSIEELENAELALVVLDGARAADEQDTELVERVVRSGVHSIAVVNKSDLETKNDLSGLTSRLERTVYVSAASGDGFEELSAVVDEMFTDGTIDLAHDAVVMGARQYAALSRATEALCGAIEDMKDGVALDVCCVGIESAMSALGELDGREVGEEIVGEIFSKFCVGK